MLAAASAGGVIGALARWAVVLRWPTTAGSFPWTTLVVNVSGCFVVGVLAGVLDSRPRTGRTRPVRAFAVTGVLGGCTTFSTWSVDVDRLLAEGHQLTATADVALTLAGAVVAVVVGLLVARRLSGAGPSGSVDPSVDQSVHG